jgi:hypothetical protein
MKTYWIKIHIYLSTKLHDVTSQITETYEASFFLYYNMYVMRYYPPKYLNRVIMMMWGTW